MKGTIIRGATILTMDDRDTVFPVGEVVVRDGRIASVGAGDAGETAPPTEPAGGCEFVDASGMILLPGFVQPHVHLCQALFRGLAEDRPLLDWLRSRIWPLEAAHDPRSMAASARLGIHEMISSGTTSAIDMATVRHTDVIFEVAEGLGFRLRSGKAMMDIAAGAPPWLGDRGEDALRESSDLARRWHGAAGGLLGYVMSPRFLLGIDEGLLAETAAEARRLGCGLQTHASESPAEVDLVRRRTGMASMTLLDRAGFLGPSTVLAHVIHVDAAEMEILARSGSAVAHCPGSNAKLGSGTARVPEMIAAGIDVGIASDGAACDNSMSMFGEMRLAGYLQSLAMGPGALPARTIVRMATRAGASAMGPGSETGSIEPGRRADLLLLDPRLPHSTGPEADPWTRIVYSMDARNVAGVWIDGARVLEEGRVRGLDAAEVAEEARVETARLSGRA